MRKRVARACGLIAILAVAVTGCGGSDEEQESGAAGGGDVAAKAQQGLASLETSVLSTGPNGEEPTPAAEVELSDQELQQVKDKQATAAIVLHYGGNDWSNAQVDGLRDRLGGAGDPGDRRHRRRLQAGEAGLGHRDGPGAEAGHHHLDPDRPGRHRRRLPEGRGAGREARLHGQRPAGLQAGQGLRERRLRRQLRQRRRLRPPDGRAARRRGQDRRRLPRGRLLRHQAALRGVQGDDRRRSTRASRSSPSRASPARTSPATRRRSPRRC